MTFGSQPRDASNIPVSTVYVPNVGFIAIQGTTISTDGQGNQSALAMFANPANANITVVTSAAYTTTQTSSDFTNNGARGVKVVLNVTSAGTGSITLSIRGKDVASGNYYTLLAGAAVTTNVTNVYTVYPGLTAAANVTASDVLPTTWDVLVTANNANSITYSVGASTLA